MNAPLQPSRRVSRTGGIRDGFSMLELLVALMVIGITVATVAPRVGRGLGETRVQRASSVMATDFQRAFSLAAQKRSPVRISIDTVGRIVWVRNRARDTTYLKNDYTSASDIGLTRLQATDTTILVYPTGIANTGFNVTLNAAGTIRRRVIVSRAGQIRIITP